MLDHSRVPRLGDDDQLPTTFIGLRLWVEQEVRVHVKSALRELQAATQASSASPGPETFSSPGVERSSVDESVLEDLAELSSQQRKQALELQELKEAVVSTPPRPAIRTHSSAASAATERQEGRLHSLSLNLADQAKRLRQVSEEMEALREEVQDLKEQVQHREAGRKPVASFSGLPRDTQDHVSSLVSKHLDEMGLSKRLQDQQHHQQKGEVCDERARSMLEDLQNETQKGLERLTSQLQILRRTLVNRQQSHAASSPAPGRINHGSPANHLSYFDDQASRSESYLQAYGPTTTFAAAEGAGLGLGLGLSPGPGLEPALDFGAFALETEQSSGAADVLQQHKQLVGWSETLAAAQAHLTGNQGHGNSGHDRVGYQTRGPPEALPANIPEVLPPTEPLETTNAVTDSHFLAHHTEGFEEFDQEDTAPQFGGRHHLRGEGKGSPHGRAGAALAGRALLEGTGAQASAMQNEWGEQELTEGNGPTGKSPKGALANAALAGRTLVEGLRRQESLAESEGGASKPPSGRPGRRGARKRRDSSSSDTTDPEGVNRSSRRSSAAAAGTERRLRRASAVAAAAAAAAGAGRGSLGRRIRGLAAGIDSPMFGQRSAPFPELEH